MASSKGITVARLGRTTPRGSARTKPPKRGNPRMGGRMEDHQGNVGLTTRGNQEPSIEWLFSFRGTLRSSPLRHRLYDSLRNHKQGKIVNVDVVFHGHSADQKLEYINDILQSLFVLCPKGWSPSSYRVFETMALGRCPVIISDDWVPITGVDWERCAIVCPESELDELPERLWAMRWDAKELGRNARQIWLDNFSPRSRPKFYLDQFLSLHRGRRDWPKLPDWWWSRDFLKRNEWSMAQRIGRRLGKFNFRNWA